MVVARPPVLKVRGIGSGSVEQQERGSLPSHTSDRRSVAGFSDKELGGAAAQASPKSCRESLCRLPHPELMEKSYAGILALFRLWGC